MSKSHKRFKRPKLPACFKPCPGSPFHVGIKQPVNPAKVQCYGPGLDSKQVQAGRPATFMVDTTEAGEAPLDVTYTDSTGKLREFFACFFFLTLLPSEWQNSVKFWPFRVL